MFSYTRPFLVVFYSSSDTKDVGVDKSDFRGQLIGEKRWAICSQQGNEDSLCTLSGGNSLANSSALLALKQGAGIGVGPLLDLKCVAGPNASVLICINSSWPVGLMCTTGRALY